MQSSFLLQAFVFLLAAVLAVPIARRLGLGSVLGYLLAGAAIGPFGLRIFADPAAAMHAAEFGVVIMLFLIGLELQPRVLWRMRTAIVGMGGTQVLLSMLAIGVLAMLLGLDWRVSVAIGAILALSSTAIVMQSMREAGLNETTAGRGAFSVLLFQDIAVIPMLALFPLLAMNPVAAPGTHGGWLQGATPTVQALATVGAIAAVVLGSRFLMRPLFRIVARSRVQELFTASALLIVVGVTLLMEEVALSPALGAFIAGVVLADNEFRHEIQSDIEPFRGLLLGLFFLSVGASIDFALVASQPALIVGLALALIAVKAGVMFLAGRLFRKSRADSVLMALALAQGGEFAFVLSAFASSIGLMDQSVAAPLVAVVALSMMTTPLLFVIADRFGAALATPEAPRPAEVEESTHPAVIVAGYGRVGQTVGRLLLANGIKISVLEHDAEQVDSLRAFGRTVNYGDATRVDLLRIAGAEEAKLIVIAIDDQARALELIDTVREHFPHLKIAARAYDRRHAYELLQKGVNAMERETFESSLRLGVKSLGELGFSQFRAERAGRVFRSYDERLLIEMSSLWSGDVAAFRAAIRDRSAMFEELMRVDMAALDAETPEERDEALKDYFREARETETERD